MSVYESLNRIQLGLGTLFAVYTSILSKKPSRMANDLSISGSKITIFPDLSRRTLRLRAATKPLLALLQTRNIPYRWCFPFALYVQRQDVSAAFRSPADLQSFLKTLDLPDVSLPDWDSAFFPSTDSSASETSVKRPLSMTPRQQRTRQRLGTTPNRASAT